MDIGYQYLGAGLLVIILALDALYDHQKKQDLELNNRLPYSEPLKNYCYYLKIIVRGIIVLASLPLVLLTDVRWTAHLSLVYIITSLSLDYITNDNTKARSTSIRFSLYNKLGFVLIITSISLFIASEFILHSTLLSNQNSHQRGLLKVQMRTSTSVIMNVSPKALTELTYQRFSDWIIQIYFGTLSLLLIFLLIVWGTIANYLDYKRFNGSTRYITYWVYKAFDKWFDYLNEPKLWNVLGLQLIILAAMACSEGILLFNAATFFLPQIHSVNSIYLISLSSYPLGYSLIIGMLLCFLIMIYSWVKASYFIEIKFAKHVSIISFNCIHWLNYTIYYLYQMNFIFWLERLITLLSCIFLVLGIICLNNNNNNKQSSHV